MEEHKLAIPYRLVNIEEKQFSTFDIPEIETREIKEKVGFGFGIDPENKNLACSCHYTLLAEGQPFIHIQVTCFFNIEEKAWDKNLINQKDIVVPIELASNLASITSNTTRGVLFANTKNTAFQKYPMSLVNVANFIKKEVVLPL